MYKNYISSYAFCAAPANDMAVSRRDEERRSHDLCVLVIEGHVYPVHDWSAGGILFEAPQSHFKLEQACNMTMKFKLHDRIVDVSHKGEVIRKSRNQIAIQFAPLTADVRKKFDMIKRYNRDASPYTAN
jgi:hypothetical protein